MGDSRDGTRMERIEAAVQVVEGSEERGSVVSRLVVVALESAFSVSSFVQKSVCETVHPFLTATMLVDNCK